jgi:hypothetical protein
MKKTQTMVILFEKTPGGWGLRGDPYLWQAMQSHFEGTPLPASTQELTALVEEAFSSLTGHSLSETDPIFMESFSRGGMSSGLVSPQFWKGTVIPLICERFEDLHS